MYDNIYMKYIWNNFLVLNFLWKMNMRILEVHLCPAKWAPNSVIFCKRVFTIEWVFLYSLLNWLPPLIGTCWSWRAIYITSICTSVLLRPILITTAKVPRSQKSGYFCASRQRIDEVVQLFGSKTRNLFFIYQERYLTQEHLCTALGSGNSCSRCKDRLKGQIKIS